MKPTATILVFNAHGKLLKSVKVRHRNATALVESAEAAKTEPTDTYRISLSRAGVVAYGGFVYNRTKAYLRTSSGPLLAQLSA